MGFRKMTSRSKWKGGASARVLGLMALAAPCVIALPAFAQAAASADEASVVDEITVTASKREERLKDVPSSVTALSATSLQRQSAVKFEDYAARVPGLTVDNASVGGGLSQLSMRGIKTGLAGTPTVGFYVDDAPLGGSTSMGGGSVLAPDLDPSDLDRLEILRGPQGTLYGAGAMGGLIKFVTRAPDPSGFFGRLQADVMGVAHGEVGWGLRGMINAPLSDTAAVRLSAYTREDPGFVDDPVHGEEDVNGNRFSGGRISFQWDPSADPAVRLSALVQHQENDGNPIIDVDTMTLAPLYGDLRQSHPPGTDQSEATIQLYDLRITHDFGFAELLSATSWSDSDASVITDFSPTLAPILSGFFGVSNGGGFVHSKFGLSKFTQELRLTSPADRRLVWQAGLFYTFERATRPQTIEPVDATTGEVLALPTLLDATFHSTFKEVAAFGSVGFKFTDRFDVTVGARASHNKQKSDQTVLGVLGAPPSQDESSDTPITFLVNPRYKVSENLMLYGRIASGYRPGGPNAHFGGVAPTYDADTVVNYEAGLKADLLDRRLSLELSTFFIDWKDIQIRLVTPLGLSYTGNAAQATSKGVEAAGVFRAGHGIQIAGNVTYLDAALDKDLGALVTSIGSKGDPLPSSPRWSGSLGVDWDFALEGDWTGFVGATWRYVGERQGDFASTSAPSLPRIELPAYDAVDLRAGVKYQRWALSAYVRNVTDQRGYLSVYTQGPVSQIAVSQPRTIGLTLATEF
jgi:iron complex outermembrane receptor protein